MAKPTPLKDALKALEAKLEQPKEDMEHVKLYGFMPPIGKLDASLSTLKKCKKLSLSTNQIDKITSVSGMDSLEILSIGRNNIKKIEGLDGVSDTLKELWASYNNIEKLAGIEKLQSLEVLYLSNNLIKSWDEVSKLKDLPNLKNLLLGPPRLKLAPMVSAR
jgi:dynein light chain 1